MLVREIGVPCVAELGKAHRKFWHLGTEGRGEDFRNNLDCIGSLRIAPAA